MPDAHGRSIEKQRKVGVTDRERALDEARELRNRVFYVGSVLKAECIIADALLEAEARGVERALKVIGSHSVLEAQAAELRAQINKQERR